MLNLKGRIGGDSNLSPRGVMVIHFMLFETNGEAYNWRTLRAFLIGNRLILPKCQFFENLVIFVSIMQKCCANINEDSNFTKDHSFCGISIPCTSVKKVKMAEEKQNRITSYQNILESLWELVWRTCINFWYWELNFYEGREEFFIKYR